MQIAISVEHLSKSYRLGQIGTGTLTNDMKVWFARKMGRPNPLLKIGQTDHGNRDGETLWALNDVSFTVKQGEVLGVIGRNGAGKSTLLKILSRVTAPTSGCVKVKGRIASLLEVGTGFHPELTGRENIYLNGAILGMTRQEISRKFDEIVDFAEIEKFIDTPVKRYSSGMYVRLAFAVAAHLESEILLVDEVLAVGDAEFQKKCLGKMGDVASKEGRTVLFVSHNMGAVVSLCQQGLLLEKGSISYNGNISNAIDNYTSSLFVQEDEKEKNINSKIKIIGVNVVSESGERFIKTNDRLLITLNIQAKIINPEIICVIENENSQIVSFQKKKGKDLGLFEHSGTLHIEIDYPPLWLYPGVYSVYFWILNLIGGKEGRVKSDKYPFPIVGDTDETGKSFLSPNGTWKVRIDDDNY